MSKRITSYSKLSKGEKEYINWLLVEGELKILEVNFKKGVIVKLNDEELFIVLDTWTGFDKKARDDREDGEEGAYPGEETDDNKPLIMN
jgi:hypothetical protein